MLPRGAFMMMPPGAHDSDEDDDELSESNQEVSTNDVATTYEKDERVAAERMKQLYPSAAIAGLSLPTGWSVAPDDKPKMLCVSHNSLRVSHRPANIPNKQQQSSGNAWAIRANASIPHCCGVYYFEIRLVQSQTGCLGLGVCQRGVSNNRLPGWDAHSYGYHGDDGNFFSSSGNGTKYGEKFYTGDVVGCGVNFIENYIFFTKNGRFQGIAMRQIELQEPLYPVLGLQVPMEVVDVNFGQVPFAYDIYKDMEKARTLVASQIYKVELPALEKQEWCKKIISAWLQKEGYTESLEIFNRATDRSTEEPLELVRARKKINDLILSRRSGEALKVMDEVYPGILATESMIRIVLLLRAQNFVEMAYEFANKVDTPKAKPTNGVISIGNGTSHPSTSSLLSNPHKRTRSYVSSSASCTDSDGPPTRKVQPMRMDVDDGMNADQPCSSRNGCSTSGNGFAIQDMDTCGLEESDEVSTMSADSHHNPDFGHEESASVMELVRMGREISSMAARIDLSTNPEYAKFVETALGSLVLTKTAFRYHQHLKRSHIRKLARLVNESIMMNYYMEIDKPLPGLTLSRVLEWWQLRKNKLTTSDCSAADYVNDKKIVFGIVSSDDESSIDSDEDEDSDDSDGTGSSDFTADSESSSSSSDGEDDEDASSVSEMDEDMPDTSRATVSCA